MALLVQVKAEPRKARNANQFAKLFYQKMRSKRVKIPQIILKQSVKRKLHALEILIFLLFFRDFYIFL